ncbi:hypothetical protein IQ63_29880 [Streptomyces acidiscabies]|uniref:Uncharacterized protein n=1 Tax=Streptomyces acidiscabies TaxID=42234 RepID=A0A0L0JWZ6_9ACTN|nr:hypothetical protein IQ63_29880 [Streptomyces acidiscabies]
MEEILENLPRPWPAPRPGCKRCANLTQERAQAHSVGDGSRVVDCNVLIRRHTEDHVSAPS